MASTLTVSRNITQLVHVCAQHKKNKKLVRFLDKIRQKEKDEGVRQRSLVLIFCNKIQTLKSVAGFLRKQNHHCEALHSGIPQAKRENALNMFKAGQLQVLVATDVAARGLHVKHLRYVVNYDFPSNLEFGTAYSFFTRNLAPLSRDLIQLLERSSQEVDPNLHALAEGKTTTHEPGEQGDASAEEDSPQLGGFSEDPEELPLAPSSGGGLRITPRKRGDQDSDDASEEVEIPSAGGPPAPAAKAAAGRIEGGPKKVQKNKVKRPRGKRGGVKNKSGG
eukprot:symbB.v1.2.028479.t1/scaffold3024.1/size65071/1